MKIVVDVVNSEKVDKLTAEIDKQKKEILAWNAAMKTASQAQQQVLVMQMNMAATSIHRTTTELNSLKVASASGGMALGSLAYAIDDIRS